MTVVLIALGAAIGAPSRYLADRAVQRRFGTERPWGTLWVNIVASLILGVVVGSRCGGAVTAFVGTGFCATLSTYSAFSYETMRLGRTGHRVDAGAYVALSLVLGIGAAALGYSVGSALA